MPVIRNKRTGEQMWVPDQGPQMPANPEYPYKGPQAAAGVASTQTNTQRTAQQMQQDAALAPPILQKAQADALKAQADAEKARADSVLAQRSLANRGLTPDKVSELEGNLGQIGNLDETIASLQSQYQQNFDGRNPLEYLPAPLRPANGVFNDTAGRLLSQVSKAQGLTSQQFNTPAEQRMFFEPYIPKSSDTDEQIQSKLAALSRMAQTGRASTAAQLGRPNRGAPPRYRQGQDPNQYGLESGNYQLQQNMDAANLTPAQRAAVMQRYNSDPRIAKMRTAPRVDRNNDGIPDDVRGILGKYGVR